MGRIGIGIGIPAQGRVGPAAPPILLRDTFTGANGTQLNAHAPDVGGPWIVAANNLTIQNNQCVTPTATAEYFDVADSGQSNVTVKADVTFTTGAALNVDHVGLVIRYQDYSNFWMLQAFAGSGGIFRLIEKKAGSFVVLAAGSWSPVIGTTYTLSVTASGTTLTGYVNGVSTVTGTSADFQAATLCGLRLASTTLETADNFLVTAP